MVKIYELCNALLPINDAYNISNFIFIPITWANNLWQNWTRDPSTQIVEGSGSDAALSIPSKGDANSSRKKVLILLVNKPDWFEPNELTYLGFDNDFSEISTVDGDGIDFKLDYTDQTMAYGESSGEVIQGAKGILKYTETSGAGTRTSTGRECASVIGKLSFPKKYLIKLEVEPISTTGTIKFGGIANVANRLVPNQAYTVTCNREFLLKEIR